MGVRGRLERCKTPKRFRELEIVVTQPYNDSRSLVLKPPRTWPWKDGRDASQIGRPNPRRDATVSTKKDSGIIFADGEGIVIASWRSGELWRALRHCLLCLTKWAKFAHNSRLRFQFLPRYCCHPVLFTVGCAFNGGQGTYLLHSLPRDCFSDLLSPLLHSRPLHLFLFLVLHQ